MLIVIILSVLFLPVQSAEALTEKSTEALTEKSTEILTVESAETVTLKLKDEAVISMLDQFIEDEASREGAMIPMDDENMKASMFYAKKKDTYVVIYNLVNPLKAYDLDEAGSVRRIMDETRISYYTLLAMDDGSKASLRFIISGDDILEHGAIGFTDDFLENCYDDQLIKDTLKAASLEKADTIKMVDFLGYQFKGLYVAMENKDYIIPFYNAAENLSQYALYTPYAAEDVLEAMQIIAINHSNEKSMGGYAAQGESYLIWVAGIVGVVLCLYIYKSMRMRSKSL